MISDKPYRMKPPCRRAFTLVELVTSMVIGIVLIFAMGFVLFDNQRSWTTVYAEAHGDVAIDTFVAQTVFENVVRKASKKRAWLDVDGQMLQLYYYAETTSTQPNRYAHFYVADNSLLVANGELAPGTFSIAGEMAVSPLCGNVQDVQFALAGTSVQMTLHLSDGSNDRVVTFSAIRHRP